MPVCGVLLLWLVLSGCSGAPSGDAPSEITDAAFLTDSLWNDGRAEVAFYRVERSEDQYGRRASQKFLVGTYLVKHTFDRAAMAKAGDDPETPVSAFKYAQFYELESGSYEYKRSYVVNARQRDLQPLKYSFTSFDWCSNQYQELAFPADERVRWLMRSDDYGNERHQFSTTAHAYPSVELPLLIRGLDFTGATRREFRVISGPERSTPAAAELTGIDTVQTPVGTFRTERIVVRYESSVPSTIGETSDLRETYWRTTGRERRLVKLSAESGRYSMELVEGLRSAYWEEDLYERLERVQRRP
jgi:hypothetical protein